MTNRILASVGQNGVNRKQDVGIVQYLLNRAGARTGERPPLAVDGIAGPKTLAAIRKFQQKYLKKSDGRVDPGGETIAMLNRVAPPEPRLNDGISYLTPGRRGGGSTNVA